MYEHRKQQKDQEMDITQKQQLEMLSAKFTPKRTNAADGKIFKRMQNDLTKITKKLDMIHLIKDEQKEGRSNQTTALNSNRDRVYDILRARKSVQKQNTLKCQSKDDHTPLRDRINSYREDKKTINTFRTEKEKQHAERSKQETINPNASKKGDASMTAFTMLLGQNEKLAMRVGELESLCQSMSHKLGFFKAKYEEDTHKLEASKIEQVKENLYLQKLVYYYKSLADKMHKKLIENGIEASEQVSQSSIEEIPEQ